uniref:Sulfotransferase n=1 Tax=Dicentrarchus labrax TaxID=13489 RepID=A0A8C4ESY3_DICLA
ISKSPSIITLCFPELFDFHGVPMTHYFTDNWEKIQNFQARPDDILIVSYPKAGNTWLNYILDLLYFGQTSPERQTAMPLYARVPCLEIIIPSKPGTELADNFPTSPRLIKTHLPVQFLFRSPFGRKTMVYVAGNGKDSVVSFFHFDRMNMIQPEPGDWSSYLQRFMEGKIVFGSWYDHVNSWWKKKQSYSKLHYMFYKDLVEDTEWEIDKLCCFLGLSPSAEEKERIIDRAQFDKMKTNNMINHINVRFMDLKMSPFIRKGTVNNYTIYM